MKKLIYGAFALTTLGFLFLNNSGGAAAGMRGGRTGAPGDNAQTCAQCHNGTAFNPTANVKFFNETGTTEVTRYVAGQTYTIRLTITAGAGTPAGYGFQMLDLKKEGDVNVKGFLPKDQQVAGVQLSTVAATSRIYAEQDRVIASNVINVKWKAPANLTGTVVFYAVGNAVDGSGSSGGGDAVTPSVKVEFAQQTSSNNELAAKIQMSVSPNPTNDQIFVNLNSELNKNLQIRLTDITGRIVLNQNWTVNTGENQRALNLSSLARGAYMVQLVENQNIITKKIIKL